MQNRIIFHLENRGSSYIFHWLFYMVSGLRHINNKYSIGNDGAGKFEQNTDQYILGNATKPYNILLTCDILDYHLQTFDLIKNDFNLINKTDILPTDIIINNYGEHIINTEFHLCKDAYLYMRELLLPNIISTENTKKYYLCRNKSHELQGNSGIKRRHIINELDLIQKLKEFDIHAIYLEDYTMYDKIQLFNTAHTIISPNSGGLSFLICANPNLNVIEINTSSPHQIHTQYEDICKIFKLNYKKFNATKIDNLDNMHVNIDEFVNLF